MLTIDDLKILYSEPEETLLNPWRCVDQTGMTLLVEPDPISPFVRPDIYQHSSQAQSGGEICDWQHLLYTCLLHFFHLFSTVRISLCHAVPEEIPL